MSTRTSTRARALFIFLLASLACLLVFAFATPLRAQTETTGAIEGRVVDEQGSGIADVTVQFINQETQVPTATRTNAEGYFIKFQLQPGTYIINVRTPQGFQPSQGRPQRVFLTEKRETVPPIKLQRQPDSLAVTTPTPPPATPGGDSQPAPPSSSTSTAKTVTPGPAPVGFQRAEEGENIAGSINRTDGRRGGGYTEDEVSTLPLGGVTRTRTFDELALFLPGVAPPPQTLGDIAGPGVGAGVGSAGQFSVNGLRSRGNNFTMDGSDNNDEDIGVRRQGFLAIVPQPVESIREYRVITLLAPAQYGRNFGAQVNAVSKSGGNETHGAIFGFFNSSNLNAPNFFDNTGGNTSSVLQGRQLNLDGTLSNRFVDVFVDGQRKVVTNNAGGEDSLTLGQGGLVLGGPLVPSDPDRPGRGLFYFIAAEGHILNATREVNFNVPTVEQRGLLNSGASGISTDPFGAPTVAFPTTVPGDAIFSLFPFPNNPNGIYGRNTLTQVLPAGGQSKILSGKADADFNAFNRQHRLAARYNFTDDWRDIPVTGGAIFSTLRSRVRTQNFASFLSTDITGPNSTKPVSNELRLSYGRTRLVFDEVRNTDFLIPSEFAQGLRPEEQGFLLNAPSLVNLTLPGATFANYGTSTTVEQEINESFALSNRLAPVGQVKIAGFSPVGVDVFNFPQRRVNNTYQLADTVTMRLGDHGIVFGTDIRRTELNSDLPRNARPLLTFNGAPDLFDNLPGTEFFSGVDFAASAAPGGVFQSLTTGRGSAINLRYYQFNFFGQDEWRIRNNLTLSYGLRYEYNTVPREVNNLIERTFTTPIPAEVAAIISGVSQFIDGRTRIFDTDRNNFAPRLGLAYSPDLFGAGRTTVLRAGAGIYYDQILGAVTSQSRNVFDNFLNVNFGGGLNGGIGAFNIFTPGTAFINCAGDTLGFRPLVRDGTVNTLNPAVPLSCLVAATANTFEGGFPFTLPARQLKTPTAYHYSFTFEQQLNSNFVVSAAYVGTQGRHLLRETTPNLGPNTILFPLSVDVDSFEPTVSGVTLPPGFTRNGVFQFGRPVPNVGAVTLFTSDANSRYDALQVQVRGRYARGLQFQGNYTFSKAEDDASDVFDLAGSFALPQNSITRAGERADSNFDARHRVAYSLNYSFGNYRDRGGVAAFLLDGLELASTGQFQTGQPFTVNSIFDVNLDGNLTDRLDSTNGIVETGDRRQPLRLTGNPADLLADVGEDGSVPRNSFRAGNLLLFNVAVIKRFRITESQALTFRTEIFNLTDRDNFGIPVRFLEAPGFGQATDTVTPGRRIQFALKYAF